MTPLPTLASNICEIAEISVEQLKSKRRFEYICMVRHLFFYIAIKYHRYTLTETGQFMNDRDHTTVMASNQRCRMLIDTGYTVVSDLIEKIVEKYPEYGLILTPKTKTYICRFCGAVHNN